MANLRTLLWLVALKGGVLLADVETTREILRAYCHDSPEVMRVFEGISSSWQTYSRANLDWDFGRLLSAVEFAAEKHFGQTRANAEMTPYIVHPLGVARLLWEVGEVRNHSVLTAALLHDTLEDTATTEDEISERFGSAVLHTVKEVTNDPTLQSEENKQRQVDHAPELSQEGRLVKLADRLYNVLDLKSSPPNWSEEKVERYRLWGRKLLEVLRGTNAPLEEALDRLV